MKISSGAGERGRPADSTIRLIERAIRNSSKSRDIVLDLFGGSGTTLIACERVQAAYDQPDLFVEPPKPPVQEGMDL